MIRKKWEMVKLERRSVVFNCVAGEKQTEAAENQLIVNSAGSHATSPITPFYITLL